LRVNKKRAVEFARQRSVGTGRTDSIDPAFIIATKPKSIRAGLPLTSFSLAWAEMCRANLVAIKRICNGVGRKTAKRGFGQRVSATPGMVVDTHVGRIAAAAGT